MSFARKMKHKQAAPSAKIAKKAARAKERQQHVDRNCILLGAKILKKMKDARVGVFLLYYVYVMYYELHAPIQQLRKLPEYIDDIQWYLRFSYDENGKLQKKPSIKLLDCMMQIKREKRYLVDVRTSYDPNDDILCELVKTVVQLECQLMWITADPRKFPGFGKVKLGKLQQRIHELESTLTWEQQQEMREKVWTELSFSFDVCAKEDFSPWIWDAAKKAA